MLPNMQSRANKAFHPTNNPLRSLSAVELDRQAAHHCMDRDRPLVVGLAKLAEHVDTVMTHRPSCPTIVPTRQPPHGLSAYVGHGPTNPALSMSIGRSNARTNSARPQQLTKTPANQPPNPALQPTPLRRRGSRLILVVSSRGRVRGIHWKDE